VEKGDKLWTMKDPLKLQKSESGTLVYV